MPTFVDLNFYRSDETLIASSSFDFICWREARLAEIEGAGNLDEVNAGFFGLFRTTEAEKVGIFGIQDPTCANPPCPVTIVAPRTIPRALSGPW